MTSVRRSPPSYLGMKDCGFLQPFGPVMLGETRPFVRLEDDGLCVFLQVTDDDFVLRVTLQLLLVSRHYAALCHGPLSSAISNRPWMIFYSI
jgi:hypothetical protein